MGTEGFRGALLSILLMVLLIAPAASLPQVEAYSGFASPVYSMGWGSKSDASVIKTEIRTLIYPSADIYAFGEYANGYSRSQLKFDISGIPPGSGIILAKLWMYRSAADNWDGNVALYRVENQVWGENITAIEFDAQILTDGENHAGKFISPGWDNLDVENQLIVDHGAGHAYSSYRLRWANDNGGEPSAGIDDGRFLVIESGLDELFIIFYSSEYNGSDPYLEVVYVPPHVVSVSVSPAYRSGPPGEELSYTVMVANTGNLDDNYVLTVSDNAGWGPTVFPTSLALASGTEGEVTLTVTVPENVAGCTRDNITVIATSQADNTVSDNDSCVAHIQVVRGVEVLLEPENQLGVIGKNAVITVTVKNIGNIRENFKLENSDDAGWALKLDNDYLEIPEYENRETRLIVSIPDNKNLICTTDNITVIATAVDNAEVTDNDKATVHAVPSWTGTATFGLENLYVVRLEKNLDLYQGSKLVVKFYTYWNVFENESVIDNFVPPWHVEENEKVPHPLPWCYKSAVKKVRLDLTFDNTEDVISTITSFIVTRNLLNSRLISIYMEWPFASMERRNIMMKEITDIYINWPFAPM